MRVVLQSCVAVLAISAAAFGQDIIPWQPNLETAQRVAAETNRLVLIHFWAPWCRPCVRLEREVFSKHETAKGLEANFVMVKLNADDAPGTTRLYGVSSLPTDVITTPAGRMVSQIQSPPTAAQYVSQMNQAAEGHRSLARKPERPVQQAQPPVGGGASYAPQTAPAATSPAGPPPASPQQSVVQNGAPPSDPYAEYFPQDQAAPTGAPSYGQVTPAQAYSAVPNTQPAAPNSTMVDPYATPAAAPSATADPYAAPQADPYAAPVASQPPAADPYAQSPAPPAADPYAAPPTAPPPATNPYATAPPTQQAPVAQQAPQANPYAATPPAQQAPPANPYRTAPGAGQVAAPPVAQAPYQPPQTPTTAPAPRTAAIPQLPPGCPPVGLDGNCPVTLVERKRWVMGHAAYGAVHRGRTYLFLGPQEKEKFLADPDRYSPVLSGIDPVLALDNQVTVPGRREFGVFGADGHIYLFADENSRARFEANEQSYTTRAQQAAQTQYQAMRPR